MMVKKTVLCAIDFSESSLKAIKWALTLAKLNQEQVAILFCYRLIAEVGEGESLKVKRDIETKAFEQFQEIEKKLVGVSSVPYQFLTEIGFFSSRIEMFIRRSPVSALVLGNSVVSNFNEYKNLSLDQFLQKTKIPIVIVPGGGGLP
ncbi:MAG: universal stress protein, partial [Cyclobacteriaceae bacterium]|nr:universal stress protein [Cyclobacteriaceae bacterium]